MWKDLIVEEVRKVRDEHAARFNYDLEAIYRDLKEQERTSGYRYVRFEGTPAGQESRAVERQLAADAKEPRAADAQGV